jgi:hypothetical protein
VNERYVQYWEMCQHIFLGRISEHALLNVKCFVIIMVPQFNTSALYHVDIVQTAFDIYLTQFIVVGTNKYVK